ncbi:alpha/beta fold hydrolase [Amycolatopsis sp. GM8]|uniref:alpha/beta fold hydrolase n=1 Tax=Amycolatopsis sp. GM8 TaxID=2896530 RepID=UPI001F1F6A33|nr:alpha/beta fold hydrolase [Amycolatopsis sp. GM8]
MENTPGIIRGLDRQSRRHETPCGDGSMVWRSWGSGTPVLLLHGSHGSWLHWVRNIAELSRHRRVLAADLPGYGESAAPADLESPDSHAAAIAEGLRLLLPAGPAVDVVGFSLGGLLGAHLAVLAPDLVRRLVLVDTGGLGTPLPGAHLALKPLRGLDDDARRATRRHNLRAMMIHDAANVDDLALWIDEHTARPTSRVHYQVVPDKLLPVLPKVPVQVDAIWGEYDAPHPGPEVNAAALRQSHPAAELRTVRGAGHWSMFEGAPEFNRALADLLAQPLREPVREAG